MAVSWDSCPLDHGQVRDAELEVVLELAKDLVAQHLNR